MVQELQYFKVLKLLVCTHYTTMVNTAREVDGKFRLPCNSINARPAGLSHYLKLYEIRVVTVL